MKLRLFIILALGLFFSCRNDSSTQEIVKLYQKQNIRFDENLTSCIIIPEGGCSGCIDGSIHFIRSNLNLFQKESTKSKVIFTAIISKKMLLNSIKIESFENYNFEIDHENKYIVESNNSIYPLIVELSEGEIINAEFQTPSSGDVIKRILKSENNDK